MSCLLGRCVMPCLEDVANKDPLPLFEKSRVVILVAGFSLSSHRYGYHTLMGLPVKIGPPAERTTLR